VPREPTTAADPGRPAQPPTHRRTPTADQAPTTNDNYPRLVQLLSAPIVRPADVGPQVTLSVEHVARCDVRMKSGCSNSRRAAASPRARASARRVAAASTSSRRLTSAVFQSGSTSPDVVTGCPSTESATVMFPRVAFEYGQRWSARSISSRASSAAMCGACRSSET
jgi:hypothetical protein